MAIETHHQDGKTTHVIRATEFSLGNLPTDLPYTPPLADRKRLSKTDIVVGAKLMTRDGRTATITDVHPECDHSRKPIEGVFPDGSLGNWMMTGSVWVNGQVDGGDLVGVAPPSPQMNCAFLCPVNLNSCRKFEVQPISVLGQLDRQFASGGRRNLHLDLMRRLVITIIDFVLALRTNVSYSQDNVLRDRRDAPFDQPTGLNFPVIIKVPFASIGIGHCGAPVTRKSCSDNTPRLPNPLSTIRGRLRENPAPAPNVQGIDLPRLQPGTPVQKIGGYPFQGTVVAAFETLDGNERFVVEATHEAYRGMLHIFNGGQLRVATEGNTNG